MNFHRFHKRAGRGGSEGKRHEGGGGDLRASLNESQRNGGGYNRELTPVSKRGAEGRKKGIRDRATGGGLLLKDVLGRTANKADEERDIGFYLVPGQSEGEEGRGKDENSPIP